MKNVILKIIILVSLSFQMNAQEHQDLEDIKERMLADAIGIGNSFSISLDYSDQSIEAVDTILAEMHKDYLQTKDEEGLKGIALIFSYYIIAVIEKNHGKGRLERNHSLIGENSFPFYWKDATYFPYGWCLKRIYDGEQDSIAFKYHAFVLSPQ